jgi:hypothetical protein
LSPKVVPKAACANEIVQRHWRKSTNESKEKTEQKFDAAFGKFLELVSVFKKSKQKLYIYFSLGKAGKKCARTRITDLISKSFKKHSHLVT